MGGGRDQVGGGRGEGVRRRQRYAHDNAYHTSNIVIVASDLCIPTKCWGGSVFCLIVFAGPGCASQKKDTISCVLLYGVADGRHPYDAYADPILPLVGPLGIPRITTVF